MLRTVSVIVFVLCCLSAALAVCAIPVFVHAITQDSEGWTSKFFGLFVGPSILVSALTLGVSAMMYRKESWKLDIVCVYISGITIAVAVLAWIAVEPMRQWIIFGK